MVANMEIQMPADTADPQVHADRIAWAAQMRLMFSPAGMLNPDGTVNQEFFKPKRVVLINEKRWGDAENEALIKGLEKHGVGSWREIREEFLPGMEDQQLRIRTSRLLGSQSLARYAASGWRGDKQAVQAERAANEEIGRAIGCWKGGLLVENDAGDVAKYLQQQMQVDKLAGQEGLLQQLDHQPPQGQQPHV